MQSWEMSPEKILEKITNMTWSFSRLQSYSACTYAWYLHYIEEIEGLPNAWAQFGTVCHETLEKFLKGELTIFDAVDYYDDRYREVVTADFPPNKYCDLGEKTYIAGKEYFSNLNFDFDKYEILGVEKELLFNLGIYKFKGYADAIYRDKMTGEIILRDHKTSSFKYLKSGEVSSTCKDHFDQFVKQEYLYCQPLIEEYGKVDYLSWNMIRDGREIKIPFNEADYLKAQAWAIETIESIHNELLWLPDDKNSFFCNSICDCRGCCPYRKTGNY